MIRAKLLYAVLLVVLFLFWILYRGTLSFQLLIFGLLFPIPLWLMLFLLRRALTAELHHTEEQVHTGTTFAWVLSIHNSSLLPAPYAVAELEYSTSLSAEVQKLHVQLPVLPRNTQRVQFRFHAATCGVQKLHITKLCIYDPLHLFCRTVISNASDTLLVLPAPDPMRGESWALHQHSTNDSDTYDKHKPGDDPSEVFDMHLYREGDAVSRINWKLSAKLDQLLVKEYSLPIAERILLLPDFRQTGTPKEAALRLDAMLGAMHTAADYLLERGVPFAMLRDTPKAGILISDTVESAEMTEHYFYTLLSEDPAKENYEASMLLHLAALLTDPMLHDHVVFFVPHLSDRAAAELSALADPSRLTVFAVRGSDEPPLNNVPFEWIALPVTPAPEPQKQSAITVLTEAEMYLEQEEGGAAL